MKKPVERGQLIKLTFEGREFEVIVIDPNGLGKGLPSVGFGFRMMEKYGGLPEQTLSNWLTKESAFEGDPNNEVWELKPSPDNRCRVTQILGTDKNEYIVVEASDWVALVIGVLKNPGKVRKSTQGKLIDFLGWFAVKGFYADAYTVLKDEYTAKDSRVLSAWMEARLMGKRKRNKYTDFLQEQGIQGQDYAYWTDYVYLGLFNMPAWQMKRVWEVKEGDSSIGRNHIPEVQGLEAVAYCENQVMELFHENLQQAHDDAINFAKKKFRLSGE
jgi:hypothetical protein